MPRMVKSRLLQRAGYMQGISKMLGQTSRVSSSHKMKKKKFFFEALYAVHFLGYDIYITVQQLHYFIRDQIGYSIYVLQLIVNFITEIHDEL